MSTDLGITILIFCIYNKKMNHIQHLLNIYYILNKASLQFKSTDTEYVFGNQDEYYKKCESLEYCMS